MAKREQANLVQETRIAAFRGREVRKTIHEDEWWFVVEDVVGVLTDSADIKQYINRMRQRDSELSKGWVQFVHTLQREPKLSANWGTICTPQRALELRFCC